MPFYEVRNRLNTIFGFVTHFSRIIPTIRNTAFYTAECMKNYFITTSTLKPLNLVHSPLSRKEPVTNVYSWIQYFVLNVIRILWNGSRDDGHRHLLSSLNYILPTRSASKILRHNIVSRHLGIEYQRVFCGSRSNRNVWLLIYAHGNYRNATPEINFQCRVQFYLSTSKKCLSNSGIGTD